MTEKAKHIDDARARRVLILSMGLGPGGVEHLIRAHVAAADSSIGYSCAYVIERPHSLADEIETLGAKTTWLGATKVTDPRWLRSLVSLVKHDNIDLVHIHSPVPASIARPALRIACRTIPIVYTEHNRWDRYSLPTRLANHATFGCNTAQIAVSNEVVESLPVRHQKQTPALVHGIDVAAVSNVAANRAAARRELGIPNDTVLIGTVANFKPAKDYPNLIDAAKIVINENPNVVFVAIGQGPMQTEVEQLVENAGLGDSFRLLGFRADAQQVMSGFDIFTLASEFEGLPVALMEAKALGLPVVATRAGGVASSVDSGVDGVLVNTGDSFALAEALLNVANDDEARASYATASKSSAWTYDIHDAVAFQENLYRELWANN